MSILILQLFFSEFVSTFVMLFVGLGACIAMAKPTRIKITLSWFAGVFLGLLTGNLLGSSRMNLVFLFVDLSNQKIDYSLFFILLIAEILGAISATLILMKLFNKKGLQLNNFAVVSPVQAGKKSFVAEIMVTFSIIFISSIVGDYINGDWKILLTSGYIGLVIYTLMPISGASFNPVRDFVPRCVYGMSKNDWSDFNKSISSSNIAPLVAGAIWLILLKII